MRNRIQYNSKYETTRWVGFFDLLGIKRIIEDKDTISVFVPFSSAIEEIKYRDAAFKNVEYTWFSDSFLVYTTDDSVQSFDDIDNISRWFFYNLLSKEIPLRGSISCGAFYADKKNSLFFGKALIEAHKYGESQNWIGFILCPSAEQRLRYLGHPVTKRLYYREAKIPYSKKRGTELIPRLPACIIGKWVSVNDRNPCIDRLIQMKNRTVDNGIIQKYEYTIKFLESNKSTLD